LADRDRGRRCRPRRPQGSPRRRVSRVRAVVGRWPRPRSRAGLTDRGRTRRRRVDRGSTRRRRAGRLHYRRLIYNTHVVSSPERYGSYLVYEQLGKGGMATVHRAELRGRNGEVKHVALKRLLPTLEKDKVQLFLDEARLHKYLHHPNIAETYDSGRV